MSSAPPKVNNAATAPLTLAQEVIDTWDGHIGTHYEGLLPAARGVLRRPRPRSRRRSLEANIPLGPHL